MNVCVHGNSGVIKVGLLLTVDVPRFLLLCFSHTPLGTLTMGNKGKLWFIDRSYEGEGRRRGGGGYINCIPC